MKKVAFVLSLLMLAGTFGTTVFAATSNGVEIKKDDDKKKKKKRKSSKKTATKSCCSHATSTCTQKK